MNTRHVQESGKPKNTVENLTQLLRELALSINTLPRMYTIEEAAEYLRVKKSTIENHIWRKRDLRYCIIGREVRIKEEDLKDFVNRRQVPCVLDTEILP